MEMVKNSKLQMFDGLRHIRAFLTVSRLRNFTRASAELHITQPALTVQIQQLETALGVTLLDRSKSRNKRQVSLTQAGADLLPQLERILRNVESLVSTSRELIELRRGTVNVAAMPSIAATFFSRALVDFSRRYPGVVVRLHDAMGKKVAQSVKSGSADFGVGYVFEKDRELTTELLFTERICVFAHKSHPLAAKKHVRLSELPEHKVILSSTQTSARVILERALERKRIWLRPTHETSHLSETIGLVRAQLGIAILPECAIDYVQSDMLRSIPIVEPTLTREVAIIGKAGHSFSLASRMLIETLRRVAPESTGLVSAEIP